MNSLTTAEVHELMKSIRGEVATRLNACESFSANTVPQGPDEPQTYTLVIKAPMNPAIAKQWDEYRKTCAIDNCDCPTL